MQHVFMPIFGTLGSPFSGSLRLEAIACSRDDHCRRRQVVSHDQRGIRGKSHSSSQLTGMGLLERRLNAEIPNDLQWCGHRVLAFEAPALRGSDSRFHPSYHCGNHLHHDRRGAHA